MLLGARANHFGTGTWKSETTSALGLHGCAVVQGQPWMNCAESWASKCFAATLGVPVPRVVILLLFVQKTENPKMQIFHLLSFIHYHPLSQ